jgi:HEAT repeat protein
MKLHRYSFLILFALGLLVGSGVAARTLAQNVSALTPVQREIERLRAQLSSSEIEARRDALVRLGILRRVESARVAAGSLNDASDMVRATAAHAALSLPANEFVDLLVPMLNDKSEFVRQQVAYLLGEAKNNRAVPALVASLAGDKQDSVRGASAVALGNIADQAGVLSLTTILDGGQLPAINGKKKKSAGRKENEFVARAAAHSLGQIRSPLAVPSLARALNDPNSPADLRREAAAALGAIGDAAASPALRATRADQDPHLAAIVTEALKQIERRPDK